MNIVKNIDFLKPRFLNILLTLFVLCLPILREQYNNGEYVTYHRPIVVMVDDFRNFQQPHLTLVMAIFIFVDYLIVSLAVVGITRYFIPTIKKLRVVK